MENDLLFLYKEIDVNDDKEIQIEELNMIFPKIGL